MKALLFEEGDVRLWTSSGDVETSHVLVGASAACFAKRAQLQVEQVCTLEDLPAMELLQRIAIFGPEILDEAEAMAQEGPPAHLVLVEDGVKPPARPVVKARLGAPRLCTLALSESEIEDLLGALNEALDARLPIGLAPGDIQWLERLSKVQRALHGALEDARSLEDAELGPPVGEGPTDAISEE
jgi:hypothetical protein